jgi:hypothetical protein
MTLTAFQLRDEALLMLRGEGAILDVARRISKVLDTDPPTHR